MKEDFGVVIRNQIKPGDMGYITYLHGKLYAEEYGFDHTFEPYVAIPLAKFIQSAGSQERIWVVQKGEEITGSIAIVKFSKETAQLRWLLLHPKVRGRGLGRKLVEEAVIFSRECGYASVFLWTVDILYQAAGLYRSFGFGITEEKRSRTWGVELTEQKYQLKL